MVMGMKGTISKIWENKLDDGRTYMTLSIDGERYNVWDKKYFGNLNEGDSVSFNFSQKGKYKNISAISKADANPNAETDSNGRQSYNGHNGNGFDHAFRKDLEIVRMSCLKTALSATDDLIDLPLDEKADTIIDVAKKFESYVTDFKEFLSPPAEENDEPKGRSKEASDYKHKPHPS